jgi:propane monooxygenase small subunit
VYENFDGTAGKKVWLENPDWQPLRRLIEEVMTVIDWNETIVATMLALEPLIGEPMRRLVFGTGAAQRRDLLMPAAAGTATIDWQRNAKAIRQYFEYLTTAAGGEGNREILAGWMQTWRDKAQPVAEGLFGMLESAMPEPGLAQQAQIVADEESRRAGEDIISGVLSAA